MCTANNRPLAVGNVALSSRAAEQTNSIRIKKLNFCSKKPPPFDQSQVVDAYSYIEFRIKFEATDSLYQT